MQTIIIYESLTGTTKRAALLMADALRRAGVDATSSPITNIDYQALAAADVVVVGTWTDGMVFVGQRPGRQGRIKQLPVMYGKRCFVYCMYAVDPGKALEKLGRIVEDRGGNVLGGLAIKRTNIDNGVRDFVDRLLDLVGSPSS